MQQYPSVGIDARRRTVQSSVLERMMDDAFAEIQLLYHKVQNQEVRRLSKAFIRKKLLPIIRELCGNPESYSLIVSLKKKDSFTFRHCVGVALITFWIGKWLGMEKQPLHDLTVSGFLHDIGKLKTSDAILKKNGKLTEGEYEEIKRHAINGFELIRSCPELSAHHAVVALQHHERENGSGYPYGVGGARIDSRAKIVAVADVFHTMISERVYKKPVPLLQALEEIYRHEAVLFDSAVVKCFVSHMMSGMIGSRVRLSNGQAARIVKLHSDDLLKPVVEVGSEWHDMRKSIYQIVGLLEEDVDAIV